MQQSIKLIKPLALCLSVCVSETFRMKQRISDSNTSFMLILLALLLLLSYSTISTSARHLHPPHQQGDEEVKADQMISNHADSSTEIKMENDLYNLMGFEEVCEEVDEECLKRRMIAEPHLDYIYTQHHHKDKITPTSP